MMYTITDSEINNVDLYIYTCGLYIPPNDSQYINILTQNYLMSWKETSNSFPPKDQYSSWVILILEQENIRIVSVMTGIT